MQTTTHTTSAALTWSVVGLLVLLVLAKGFFSFYVVTDRGQPSWDYRAVRDVPGESPYAIYQPGPYPQHIRGAKGE